MATGDAGAQQNVPQTAGKGLWNKQVHAVLWYPKGGCTGAMINKSRNRRSSPRDLVTTTAPAVLIVIVAFWVAYQFVEPAPPNTIVMSTGAEDGAYQTFGKKYRDLVSDSRITLELRTSAGSLENLSRLTDSGSGVSVALVQGGIASAEAYPGLQSLGTVFNEPLWVFYRGSRVLDRLTSLKGMRVSIGPEGSGLRFLAMVLLEANGMLEPASGYLDLPTGEAADALMSGNVDAVFVVAAVESETVQRLLRAPGVRLMDLDRAEGYGRKFPYLSPMVLPQGTVDFGRNIPERDTRLLVSRANLVARSDLHPALIYVLLDAAEQVHNRSGLFQKAGEFPSGKDTDLPLSDVARQFYKSGRPFLQRYLPFWIAVFIDRMVVLLLPLVAVLLPVFRFLPMIYTWRVRSRIFRRYGELRYLEQEIDTGFDREKVSEYLEQLDRIEEAVNRSHTPVTYSDLMYNFRLHLQIVRDKIRARESF